MVPLDRCGVGLEQPRCDLGDDRWFTVERVEPCQRLSSGHSEGRAGNSSQHAATLGKGHLAVERHEHLRFHSHPQHPVHGTSATAAESAGVSSWPRLRA